MLTPSQPRTTFLLDEALHHLPAMLLGTAKPMP